MLVSILEAQPTHLIGAHCSACFVDQQHPAVLALYPHGMRLLSLYQEAVCWSLPGLQLWLEWQAEIWQLLWKRHLGHGAQV